MGLGVGDVERERAFVLHAYRASSGCDAGTDERRGHATEAGRKTEEGLRKEDAS